MKTSEKSITYLGDNASTDDKIVHVDADADANANADDIDTKDRESCDCNKENNSTANASTACTHQHDKTDEEYQQMTTSQPIGNTITNITHTKVINELTTMIVREGVKTKEIPKGVLRKKLSKMRHLVVQNTISKLYIEALFSEYILPLFQPQTVTYNGGVANVKNWKISCYLEVMEGGIPCTDPHYTLREHCLPLLDSCNDLFIAWYRQQHACNSSKNRSEKKNQELKVRRLMTFITRYTPAPGEQALLKHVDGAGKVDGSIVVALPTDRWSGPEEEYSFEGFGGGLTFWDGRDENGRPKQIDYDTRSGDIAFIDRAVWHQANPITRGTRWALVIFYKVIR